MKLSCQEGLIPGETFAEKLRNLERYGFEGVELNGGRLNDPAGLAERKAALRDSPVKASSICGGYPAELLHPDRARRQACADALKRHLDYAAELGAVGPITVPIFNSNDRLPDLSPWKTRAEAEKELLLAMLQTLVPHAEQVGAAILLEPLNRYESNSLPQQKDGAAIVRALNSRGVRLMSDVFHMHIEETNSPAALREVGDAIGHVHLADNTRKEPGSGDIDFRAIMAALKEVGFTGYMAFECGLSGPAEQVLPRSVAFLKECIAGQ
ncbi:MAG TPA: sugar phosphate isomerase/epimerase family protein [Chthonomonadaceae bacterium]|nr:sugar phosphate isomerase/epimerase family protein [Chthonomonadaceae bacterium]